MQPFETEGDTSPPLVARLPLELIDEVLLHSARTVQLNACHLSTTIHSLSIRHIYRHVCLSTAETFFLFCRAILAHPMLATIVRELHVSWYVH